MQNEYVLNHDFGYGNFEGYIHKLRLRNLEDLKVYIEDILKSQFVGIVQRGEIKLLNERKWNKVDIKKVDKW